MDKTAFTEIIEKIKNNQEKHLILKDTSKSDQITKDQITELTEALKINTSLISIILYTNNIDNQGVSALAEASTNENSSLTSIVLWSENMGDQGVIALAEASTNENCSLTWITIGGDNIGDQGAIALAEAFINKNCSLTSIVLYTNNIGDQGVIALAKASTNENCSLTSITLSSNNIGNQGAIALAKALINENCSLTSIVLSKNKMGEPGKQVLRDALKKNFTILELYLDEDREFNDSISHYLQRNNAIESQFKKGDYEITFFDLCKLLKNPSDLSEQKKIIYDEFKKYLTMPFAEGKELLEKNAGSDAQGQDIIDCINDFPSQGDDTELLGKNEPKHEANNECGFIPCCALI